MFKPTPVEGLGGLLQAGVEVLKAAMALLQILGAGSPSNHILRRAPLFGLAILEGNP